MELRIRPDLDPPRRVAFGAMPNITINQESVSLIEQERVTFQRFVELAFPQCVTLMGIPRERRFISMLPASYVLKRREDGVGWDAQQVVQRRGEVGLRAGRLGGVGGGVV